MRSRGAALLPWAVLWPIILGWAAVCAWCYHNQQSAPTIHQSFIWNNSTADSWNKTSPPLQADDSQPDKGSDLGLKPAVLPHALKHRHSWLTCFRPHLLCVWGQVCVHCFHAAHLLVKPDCVSPWWSKGKLWCPPRGCDTQRKCSERSNCL